LITDEELTEAAGPDNSDAAIARAFLTRDGDTTTSDREDTDTDPTDSGSGAVEGGGEYCSAESPEAKRISDAEGALAPLVRSWFADSAYGVGDLRAAVEEAGHRVVIKPMHRAVDGVHRAVTGRFSLDDFTVDEQAATVTCPNQITRLIGAHRGVSFRVAYRSCPLAERCSTSKSGRPIALHEHDDQLRAARRNWGADPEVRAEYAKHRPNIERTVEQVATRGGRRLKLKLRYRDTVKNNAWLKRRTASLNPRNLIGRGLDHVNGTWIVATA